VILRVLELRSASSARIRSTLRGDESSRVAPTRASQDESAIFPRVLSNEPMIEYEGLSPDGKKDLGVCILLKGEKS
jgi:hypothetical protein